MTTIETTILSLALAEIETARQRIAQACSKEHNRLDDGFEREVWDRLAWMSKQLRRAEAVLTAHNEEACPLLREEPADDWRGAMTL